MKRYCLLAVLTLVATLTVSTHVEAVSLKVAPMEYRTSLGRGEKKRGFIDVSNPTSETVRVHVDVQRFDQIDNQGSLRFYDDEQLKSGVLLDVDEVELGPREALRMFFDIDGSRLPKGDLYGAIFFATKSSAEASGVAQQVRVGTLLSIINETPGQRKAEITRLNTDFIHFDSTIRGEYTIKNTGSSQKSTGFYPQTTLGLCPFGSESTKTGKLIFAGRERTNNFELEAPSFGFYKITAAFGDSQQSRWVFVIEPFIAVILLGVVMCSVFVYRIYTKRRKSIRTK